MTLRIRTLIFDCREPYELAQFWSRLTGYAEDPANPNHPDDPVAMLVSPERSLSLLFVPVPEHKTVKNRVHVDLTPPEPGQCDAEVDRAVALGAKILDNHRRPNGTGWVVLADPEGNEFCISGLGAKIMGHRNQ